MANKDSSPALQGHVVIRSQQEDEGQSGVVVVSNTTPMEEIDGLYNPRAGSANNKQTLERKRTNSRIATEVEKNVRIRTTRVPSAKSAKSGGSVSVQKLPISPKSDFPSPKLDQEEIIIESPDETERLKQKQSQALEESKLHDYEAVLQGRLDLYSEEEENYICYRFPHLNFCACGVDYFQIKSEPPVEAFPGIYISTLPQALISKNLLKIGITHILNLSAVEFTKRYHYFEYLNLDIFDTHDEDIKKHFRITNRFIAEALQNGGKVLVHSFDSKSRAPAFISAYLIGKKKKTLKNSIEIIKQGWPDTEINNYFFQQLEQYDLEKLAIGSTIKV